jgi:hypothetical protein
MPRIHFSDEVRQIFGPFSKAFDDYEAVLDSWESRYLSAAEVAIEEQKGFGESGEYWARRLISSQATNSAARLYRLGEALVLLVNDGNRQAIPAIVRPIIETAGAIAYSRLHLLPRLEKGRREQVKVMLYRLGLGGDPGIPETIRPIPVNSLIKAYASVFAEQMHDPAHADPLLNDKATIEKQTRFIYSTISDYTHPNGAAMEGSFARREDGGGTWNLWMPPTEEDMYHFFFTGSLAIEQSRPMWDALMAAADDSPLLLPNEEDFGVKDFPDEAVHVEAREAGEATARATDSGPAE